MCDIARPFTAHVYACKACGLHLVEPQLVNPASVTTGTVTSNTLTSFPSPPPRPLSHSATCLPPFFAPLLRNNPLRGGLNHADVAADGEGNGDGSQQQMQRPEGEHPSQPVSSSATPASNHSMMHTSSSSATISHSVRMTTSQRPESVVSHNHQPSASPSSPSPTPPLTRTLSSFSPALLSLDDGPTMSTARLPPSLVASHHSVPFIAIPSRGEGRRGEEGGHTAVRPGVALLTAVHASLRGTPSPPLLASYRGVSPQGFPCCHS